MNDLNLRDILSLRTLVGYLGEEGQFNWWSSSFFSNSSIKFLSPIFGKTSFSSQYYGAREAATNIHDEHIGIGRNVFHLFRLPETQEKLLHSIVCDESAIENIKPYIQDTETALGSLKELSKDCNVVSVGPVRLGSRENLADGPVWREIANYYLKGFSEGKRVYPYFSDEK